MVARAAAGHAEVAAAVDAYLDAVRHGRRREAIAVALGLLDAGVAPETVITDLLVTSQAAVGRAWQENRWSIAMEHRATAITEAALEAVTVRALAEPGRPPEGSAGSAVVLCVEGEWHTLPARMAADVLRLRGVDVTFVGPSMPAEEVAAFLGPEPPAAVAVACSLSLNLVGAWRMITGLRRLGTTVVCGGRGFGADGRWARAVGGDLWAPDLVTGADLLMRATGEPPPPPRGRAGAPAAWPEVDVVRRDGAAWVERAMQAVRERWPSLQDNVNAVRATREDLASTLRVLASAALVDDATLVVDFVSWFEGVVSARALPLSFVFAAFSLLLDVIPDDLPALRGMALAGSAACTQPYL